MVEFEEIEFFQGNRKETPKNKILVTKSKNNYNAVTVNAHISRQLSEKGLDKVRVMRKKNTGDIMLLFNKENGLSFTLRGMKTISIHCKPFVDFLFDEFNPCSIKSRFYINISDNKSKRDDIMTFILQK